jgi:hypothetical protein
MAVHMNFLKILDALKTISDVDTMNLVELSDRFAKATMQEIPKQAIDEFAYTGLSNTDFLTSDYLTKFGLKNIYEVDFNQSVCGVDETPTPPGPFEYYEGSVLQLLDGDHIPL